MLSLTKIFTFYSNFIILLFSSLAKSQSCEITIIIFIHDYLRLDLSGESKEMFEAIKNKYNLRNNTEVMRLIIKSAYDHEIKKP